MGMFAGIVKRLKGARRLELYIAVAAAAALFLLLMDAPSPQDISPMEARMERVLSDIDGAGRVSVLINENGDGRILGVLVVSEGADDLSVRLRLLGAVKVTLGADAAQIEIVEMEGAGR